jgi:hypothetical protein
VKHPVPAAGDLFPSELLDVVDFLFADEKKEWLGDGEQQDLHRLPANRRTDGAGHRAVIVDIAIQHGRAGEIGRHINNLKIDTFVLEKTPLESGVKRQEGDVGGRAAHTDFLQRRLRMNRLRPEKLKSKNG